MYSVANAVTNAVKNSPNSIFRSLRDGDEQEVGNAVALVNDRVGVATALTKVLADFPDEEKITILPENKTYSRKQIQKIIDIFEDARVYNCFYNLNTIYVPYTNENEEPY